MRTILTTLVTVLFMSPGNPSSACEKKKPNKYTEAAKNAQRKTDEQCATQIIRLYKFKLNTPQNQ